MFKISPWVNDLDLVRRYWLYPIKNGATAGATLYLHSKFLEIETIACKTIFAGYIGKELETEQEQLGDDTEKMNEFLKTYNQRILSIADEKIKEYLGEDVFLQNDNMSGKIKALEDRINVLEAMLSKFIVLT